MANYTVPAITGAFWFRQACQLFKKAPLPYAGIVCAYVFLLFLANLPGELIQLPFIGTLLSSLVPPFAALAVTSCGRDVSLGQRPTMTGCYLEGWKNPQIRTRLMILGLTYGVGMLVIGAITGLLAASTVAQWKIVDGAYDINSIAQHVPWLAVCVASVLYLLLLGITCFSPMLVAWKGQSVAKAFFFSLVVCFRNFGAICLLGLTVFSIAIVGTVLLGVLGLTSALGSIFLVSWALIMTTLSYAALWPMWASIFGSDSARLAIQ